MGEETHICFLHGSSYTRPNHIHTRLREGAKGEGRSFFLGFSLIKTPLFFDKPPLQQIPTKRKRKERWERKKGVDVERQWSWGIIIIAEVSVKTTVNNNDVIETNLSNKG